MKSNRLPGFRLALGTTIAWLTLIVLLPLAGLIMVASKTTWAELWQSVSSARALAAYELTVLTALASAAVNSVIGLLLAWVLMRYNFPGKRLIDGLLDIPFALPTAVTGLAFASMFNSTALARTPAAIVVVLTFISLPFVVRSLQPVLEDLGTESEEAARSLGASRWQTFRWVIFPSLLPALLTGAALAFARSVGEYGSVIFVSGNIPGKTEIAPVLIVGQLEQFNYSGAAAIAIVVLAFSFALNGLINLTARWSRRHA